MKTKLLVLSLALSASFLSAQTVKNATVKGETLQGVELVKAIKASNANTANMWSDSQEFKLDSIVSLSSQYEPNKKYFFTYDKQNRTEEIVYQVMEMGKDSYEAISKRINTYDAEGKIVLHQQFITDDNDNSIFVLYYKNEYTYNEAGDITSVVNSIANGSNWVLNSRNTYTYNSKNLLTHDTYQIFGDTEWFNSSRMVYNYNTNDQLDTVYRQTVNGAEWGDNQRMLYNYYENGLLENYELQRYNFFLGGFSNGTRSVYIYNEDGLLIEEQPYAWDWEQETYIIDEYGNHFNYSYNNNDDLLSGQKLVTYSEESMYGDKFEQTFGNEKVENILGANNIQYDMDLHGNYANPAYQIIKTNTYTISGSTWEISTERTIYYSEYVETSTPEVGVNNELLYVKDRTIVLSNAQNVAIFSTTGQMVFNGYAAEIEIAQNGVYMVRTANGTHKVVIP